MVNFEKDWWLYFVPECYFDTVLLKKLLQTNKRLMHRKGCTNVTRDLDSKRLENFFAVGIIDKDKKDLNYLKNCSSIYVANKLILWQHDKRKIQFVLQFNPPLEKWIIEILNENNLRIEDFEYSRDYKKLKQQIKNDI